MSTWQEQATAYIEAAHRALPADVTLAQRRRAIQQAYPWGERSGWPYKAWLKAQRHYLGSFDGSGRRGRVAKPTGLEHLPRDPVTGRPVIP